MRPIIGITVDNQDNTAASGRYECGVGYGRALAEAGGTPVLLPHVVERAAEYVALCDGLVLTGGMDPDTAAFGEPLHEKARVMDPARQAFELALLEELDSAKPQAVCLGVCLGMQLMALRAGGKLNQYLPDTLETHAMHESNNRHAVTIEAYTQGLQSPGFEGRVVSSHRQAVSNPGAMRILATAPDGVIEAIVDPDRPFYIGVQWHPERADETDDGPLNRGLFRLLVDAARNASPAASPSPPRP